VVGISIDQFGVEMAFIPAGPFTMGFDRDENAKPAHLVMLADYYIDVYEVTNDSYKACVDAGACAAPKEKFSNTHPDYYGNPEFGRYPVLMVDWQAAQNYCAWRGGRLPTEAEWEKAARGDQELHYPWGRLLNCDKANYSQCVQDTSEVGSYPDSASPYGLYDLAGNVMEWLNDWYNVGYYASSPESNPTGPETGIKRVVRGGGWTSQPEELFAYHRTALSPDVFYLYLGFRCARPAG
jgi:serine/threonine-protein kinase